MNNNDGSAEKSAHVQIKLNNMYIECKNLCTFKENIKLCLFKKSENKY